MTIQLKTHTLSYKTPVPVRGKSLSENQFSEVIFHGRSTFISTLPSFHQLNLKELGRIIERFFSTYEITDQDIHFNKMFFNTIKSSDDEFLNSLTTEALFNIESILLGYLKDRHPHLFSNQLPLMNQLFTPSKSGDDETRYKNSLCLKIKIDPLAPQLVLETLLHLSSINPNLKFRLDGNRRYDLEELLDLDRLLKSQLSEDDYLKIDYIEEPFKKFSDTVLFKKRSSLLLAIDESFEQFQEAPLIGVPSVIKPSLYGISPIFAWLDNNPNQRAIISSSFEHPSNMHGLYFLAQKRPTEFHGLESFF